MKYKNEGDGFRYLLFLKLEISSNKLLISLLSILHQHIIYNSQCSHVIMSLYIHESTIISTPVHVIFLGITTIPVLSLLKLCNFILVVTGVAVTYLTAESDTEKFQHNDVSIKVITLIILKDTTIHLYKAILDILEYKLLQIFWLFFQSPQKIYRLITHLLNWLCIIRVSKIETATGFQTIVRIIALVHNRRSQ